MSSSPGNSGGRIVFSRVNFLCGLLFSVHSTPTPTPPPVTTVARKRLLSFCQKWPNLDWLCCPDIVWEPIRETELTRNSSGNTWPQSSELAEPLWTDPGLKSGISLHELISTLKKNAQAGNECRTFSQTSSHSRKKPPPPPSPPFYTELNFFLFDLYDNFVDAIHVIDGNLCTTIETTEFSSSHRYQCPWPYFTVSCYRHCIYLYWEPR